ncbi:hypothetical protein EDC01DRAFT_626632 [Geopyxis carbonaria]|nr:hypothetical protein EDC01DRAFT_626632 [Geopyxis carbonaria]
MTDSTPFATIYTFDRDPRMNKIFLPPSQTPPHPTNWLFFLKNRAAAKINNLTLSFCDININPLNDKCDAAFYAKFPLSSLLVGPAREQLLGATTEARAKIQQWCWHAQMEFQAPIYIGIRPKLGFVEFDAEKEAAARRDLERVLKYTEGELAKGKWLTGTEDITDM